MLSLPQRTNCTNICFAYCTSTHSPFFSFVLLVETITPVAHRKVRNDFHVENLKIKKFATKDHTNFHFYDLILLVLSELTLELTSLLIEKPSNSGRLGENDEH